MDPRLKGTMPRGLPRTAHKQPRQDDDDSEVIFIFIV